MGHDDVDDITRRGCFRSSVGAVVMGAALVIVLGTSRHDRRTHAADPDVPARPPDVAAAGAVTSMVELRLADEGEWEGAVAADVRAVLGSVVDALLPLFEDEPGLWAALPWLNAATPSQPRTFREHLGDWRRHAPPAHATAIETIAAAFGVELTDEAPPRD